MYPTENWKTQIRKGYLELCIFQLIRQQGRLYGFDLIEKLARLGLDVKEGTLYPLLSRLSTDQLLSTVWETENIKGHPRKFYSLTPKGIHFLEEMDEEFDRMVKIYRTLERNSGSSPSLSAMSRTKKEEK